MKREIPLRSYVPDGGGAFTLFGRLIWFRKKKIKCAKEGRESERKEKK